MGKGTEEGGRTNIDGAGVVAEALAIAFTYLSFPPQESVLKRAWPQQSRDLAVS